MVQKVPVFYQDVALSFFFSAYLNFLYLTPSPGLAVQTASRDNHHPLSPGQGEQRLVRRTSNNKPPSSPNQKQATTLKTRHGSTDRRGYNSYFPLTNSELILGLFLAARLMLKTKGKASHASQRAQLCSVATSSLGSRLCGGLKQQLRAVWTPLHMMGKLLLFPAR